ncbi:spindle orientation adaptor protein inscuteable [Haematobia irritans]|uniref:spindle orientation adaptor protein inscuteable n=1 Tax=Haematobia irritans TaxID=7368 RepID=UPI003F5063C9
MAFQRSYSKVWWGSDNQSLPVGMGGMNSMVMNSAIHQMLTSSSGVSLTSGGLYYGNQQQQQKPQQQQQQQRAQPQMQQHQPFGGSTYHSLDLHQYKYNGNLSRIQEVEDEHNISKLSWEKHDSPGSLRSQDSGFSDNEEFHHTRSLSSRSSKTSSPSSKSGLGSPQSTRSIQTPPTVIRKTVRSDYYTSLINVSRRISFPASPLANNKQEHRLPTHEFAGVEEEEEADEEEGPSLLEKLDSMQLMNESPVTQQQLPFSDTPSIDTAPTPIKSANPRIKKRRKIQRKATTPLSPTQRRCRSCNDSRDEENSDLEEPENRSHSSIPEYNNETVYLGGGTPPTCSTPPPPYNNETVVLGGPMDDSFNKNNTLKYDDHGVSPLRLHTRFSGHTSTPKALKNGFSNNCSMAAFLDCHEYDNTLLNGHSPDVQYWLDDLRMSYDHEVMSTLQTKSIAQEAIKHLQMTTSTVAKFIRQLQQKALRMQQCFEKTERMLGDSENLSLHEALSGSLHLLDNVTEFTHILERRSVFFADNRMERKRYEDYIDQIRMVHKDTRYSLENHHYINLESLLEDLQVLKRILLIAVRQVYEKLIRILMQSIENGRCDLMLKANINMVATLMNIDYDGFASLTDAFVQTEAVRTLLVVCLDNKSSSIRAQSLRALATICCAPEPIFQLGSCGGIEVLRDILQIDDGTKKPGQGEAMKRSDLERREAVSLLTQITAAWHGPDHRVDGLRDCVETVVEGLTRLLIFTGCPQTLLLCAAALSNLSRMEITSHYSIMSHETIFKLIETMERRDEGINVFLYEQIVAMLYNMSLNKKCHSHLANGAIVNFITYAYQTEFYKIYNSRGESEAQQRCIKTILHTLTRLVQDSVLGMELLEQHNRMPSALFYSLSAPPAEQELQRQNQLYHQQQLPLDIRSSRDISFLAQKLESLQQQQLENNEFYPEESSGNKLKMQLQRQESYV